MPKSTFHAARTVTKWLALPGVSGLDIDSPKTTDLRIEIVQRKAFLRQLYSEWYRTLRDASGDWPAGVRVELGSGPGFLKEFCPEVVTSEVVKMGRVDIVFSAERMPFGDQSLAGVYLVNVLHHLRRPAQFLSEAARCVKRTGGIVMVEPYGTPWGRLVWKRLHHEPFEPEGGWTVDGAGPLSGANGAMPWILFERDREAFCRAFPQLRIVGIRPFMPLAYLLSGGVSMRSLMPGACYRPWRALEKALGRLNRFLGMFAVIELQVAGVPVGVEGDGC